MDKLEGVCDPEKDEGEWVTHFDLVEENHRLKVNVASACREVVRARLPFVSVYFPPSLKHCTIMRCLLCACWRGAAEGHGRCG
jgi:hypothetical protein